MANRYREVRMEELTDAVMFAMAGGVAVDAESCVHAASHTLREEDEIVGAAIAYHDKDQQDTVAIHVADSSAHDAAREMLDLTLMKLHAQGVTTLRLQAEESLGKALNAAADWQTSLPTFDRTGHELDWLKTLRTSSPEAAAVVDRALNKVAEGAGKLGVPAGDTGSPPDTSADTATATSAEPHTASADVVTPEPDAPDATPEKLDAG